MGFQTGNGPHPKEDWHKVSQGAHLQSTLQIGLFAKGSAEEVYKVSIREREKRF